jgi:ornithine cyclodeaminase/alanine dehydrogenase
MPALISGMKAAGIKWVSGFPENYRRGLPYIHGLVILNDPDTGIPLSVLDATWITAMRTGAATALAARHLARPDSRSLGIIAAGVQGRSNLAALASVFNLKQVKVYDLNPVAAEDFIREMEPRFDARFEQVTSPEMAVKGMDLVVTSGPILKRPQPVIRDSWLGEGSFCSPVDFDSYFTSSALKSMDKLATDDLAQLEYYRQIGYFRNTPTPYADLGEIITGQKPGRENPRERTMSINLGLALCDMVTASMIYRQAVSRKIGTPLPL